LRGFFKTTSTYTMWRQKFSEWEEGILGAPSLWGGCAGGGGQPLRAGRRQKRDFMPVNGIKPCDLLCP